MTSPRARYFSLARARGRHRAARGAPAVDARARRPRGADRWRHRGRRRRPPRPLEVERPVPRAPVAGVRSVEAADSLSSVAPADRWRGVASEDVDEYSANVAGLLRRRSRRLLATLTGPYRGELMVAAALITIRAAAYLSLPYLVGLGIDRGIHTGNLKTLEVIVAALLLALVVQATANYAFLPLSARIAADILFDLRRTLFAHVQELSLSFYERYTSGRIISRLTSDIDALNELLATGLTSVITSVISVVAITVILVRLDARLGIVTLVAMPLVLALTYWFRNTSARPYRAVRPATVLLISPSSHSLVGI